MLSNSLHVQLCVVQIRLHSFMGNSFTQKQFEHKYSETLIKFSRPHNLHDIVKSLYRILEKGPLKNDGNS